MWRETEVLERFTGPELPVKWPAPVSNGYTGPTVASGREYVCDRVTEPEQQERVLYFDAATGKVLWKRACAEEFQARVPTFGIASDPMIDEDRVIVQFGGLNGA